MQPSENVRLEVELLAADQLVPVAAPIPVPVPVPVGRGGRQTVIVISTDVDLRRFIRECLRDRTDVRVLDAPTIEAAVAME